MREQFIELFEEILDRDAGSILADDKFREFEEWDSLSTLAMSAMINEEYDVVIPRNEFEKLLTVSDIIDYIDKLR